MRSREGEGWTCPLRHVQYILRITVSGVRPADLKLRLAGYEDHTVLRNLEDIT